MVTFILEVCFPELVLNETRQDWTSFPELAVPGKDYFFMVPLLNEIWEINGTGLKNGTHREKYWRVLNLINKLVLVGKFLTSAEIIIFLIGKAFGNSRIFPDLK